MAVEWQRAQPACRLPARLQDAGGRCWAAVGSGSRRPRVRLGLLPSWRRGRAGMCRSTAKRRGCMGHLGIEPKVKYK
jgi:hypothetical protein